MPTPARALAVSFALLTLTQPVSAQQPYPHKSIRFVIAFAPGGITDIIGRLVGEKLSARLGQPVIIDNKGGAAGALAAKIVASAEPDGYNILVTTTAVTIGSAASATAIDPRRLLTPIALAASSPTIFVAKAPTPAKNLMEFVRSKADGRVTYSSAGAGTTEHLTAAYVFKGVAGLEATHIPYRSGSETVNSVLSNQVDLSAVTPPAALSLIQDQKLRILAVAAHKRVALLPDAPTMAEIGLVDVENSSWIALFGPPNLPQEITKLLSAEVQHAIQQPHFRDRLRGLGFDLPETNEDFAKYIANEVDKWGRIIKATGVTLN